MLTCSAVHNNNHAQADAVRSGDSDDLTAPSWRFCHDDNVAIKLTLVGILCLVVWSGARPTDSSTCNCRLGDLLSRSMVVHLSRGHPFRGMVNAHKDRTTWYDIIRST